jgi:N-acetylneuraminic acid mutarotase
MKYIALNKLLMFIFLIAYQNVNADFWTQKANFSGLLLRESFTFSVGTKGYFGCGVDSTNNQPNDFWEYDPSTNAWTQKANFPGLGRVVASTFSIGNKGYVGLGWNNLLIANLLNDFWEYDPSTNAWTQKANFGGGARVGAVGFSINNYGYVGTGTGYTITFGDLWQYDPISDSWLQKASVPLSYTTTNANCFVIGTDCYLVGGANFLPYVWEYNSITDSWSQKSNFPFTSRVDACAFSICDKGYFGFGELGGLGGYGNDLWQYNPITDTWIQKANYPSLGRDEPVFFSIGDKGYVGLGGTDGIPLYNDFWEYTPDSSCITTGIQKVNHLNLFVEIFPNPFTTAATIKTERPLRNAQLKIFNYSGQEIKTFHGINKKEISLSGNDLSRGIYYFELIEDDNIIAKRNFTVY